MKKKTIKSVLTLILAISLIVGSSLGLQMLNGFAEGISGSTNPSLECTITNLNGTSLMAYSNPTNDFTRDNTYPRLVTNGSQIKVNFWAYDSEGVSSINIKLIRILESNQLYSWLQPGYPELKYNNDFPLQNYDDGEYVFNVTYPGTYAVLATTTVNGRTTQKYKFFLYGPGTIVGGDFNNRIQRPEGQAIYCTLYDLGGTGINIPATSLYVTKAASASTFVSNNGLTVTQDPANSHRYKVSGYAVRPAELNNLQGEYHSYMLVYPNNSTTSSTIYIPAYD